MHHDVNTIPAKIRNGVTIIAVSAARRVNMMLTAPAIAFARRHIPRLHCQELFTTRARKIIAQNFLSSLTPVARAWLRTSKFALREYNTDTHTRRVKINTYTIKRKFAK